MQSQMEIGSPDLGRIRLALHQRLRELKSEQARISEAIAETERRISMVDEICSWGASTDPGTQAQPASERPSNGVARLLVLRLADAIVYLRNENPDVSKKQIRQRLEGIGYRFRTEQIGRAIHAGWIAAERRLKTKAG